VLTPFVDGTAEDIITAQLAGVCASCREIVV
jgi:hypothetical protein